MARNSRFRKPGPSSDRPRPERRGGKPGKPFGRRRDDDRPTGSFGPRKKFERPGDEGSRPFRSEGSRGFSKAGGPRKFTRRGDGDDRGGRSEQKPFKKGFERREGGSRPFNREGGSRFGKPGGQRSFGKPGGPSKFFKRGDSDEAGPRSEGRPFKKGFDRKREGGDFKRGGAGGSREDRFDRKREGGGFNSDRKRGGFGGDRDEKQGSRTGQRPFYKQGFGRKREDQGEGRPGRYSREDRPEGKRKSFIESRLDRQHNTSEHRRHDKKDEAGDGLIRLNKFISNSGVCSRREADNLITMGLITVNGKSITELGYKVKPTDDIRYEGKKLTAEKMVYILINKPKGYITTTDDPQERKTVMQLIEGACKERIYPVGRLDRNTSGLLLLTNDGELTDKLTHPSYNVKKIYKAELDKPLTKADFQKIRDGVELEEGVAMIDDLAVISEDNKTIGIEIHIGWNRVIRRIFEVLGYDVIKLDRSVYAGLDKKDLSRGHWRFLRQDEVVRLKHFQ